MARKSGWLVIAAALALAAAWEPAAAQAPPAWEVRTFLDPTTDGTYQFRQSVVKQRFVCSHCSYSSPVAGDCPNPWNATGHPGTVTLADRATTRTARVLSLATPTMPANRFDVQLPDITRALLGRAVLGRPFQPRDFQTDGTTLDLRRSTLHVQVAEVTGNVPDAGADRFRFLIIPPTPDAGVSGQIKSRRPMAGPDPDLGVVPPATQLRGLHLRAWTPGAQQVLDNQLPTYLNIGLNPYRVDEGDQWFVRVTELSGTAGDPVGSVVQVRVEIFSVLYGLIADLPVTPPAGAFVEYPLRVISENGACIVNLVQPLHQNNPPLLTWQPDTLQTWTFQFMSRSNCRLMPGWQDLVDETTDPQFEDLAGASHGDVTFDFVNAPFPAAKQCWFADTGGVPGFTDQSNVVETGNPPAPYIIPNNCTGQGTVAVEYGKDTDGNWQPDPTAANPVSTTYYQSDGEWQYDAAELVTNLEAAQNTTNFDPAAPQTPYVRLIASRFMSTRVDVLPTGQTWDHGTASDVAEVDPTPDWSYPRVVIGLVAGLTVSGDYPPGSITPHRYYRAGNRWNGTAMVTMYCPVCSAIWGPDVSPAPAACPNHAGTAAPMLLAGVAQGDFGGAADVWRTSTTVGVDERVVPPVPARHVLPSDTFEYSSNWLGTSSGFKFGGTAQQAANVRIPRYQPPSVPPVGPNGVNDPTNDLGYRGGRLLHRPVWVGGSIGMNFARWDAFFKCPDCGAFLNLDDPASHNCASPHSYCQVCGSEYVQPGNCAFDGNAPIPIPANLTARQEHLQSEEFDAFELQVSVNRKAGDVYSSLSSAEMGRTAPGTPSVQPDTTVGPLTTHRAFPSDVSDRGEYYPRNEGNVTIPVRVANVFDFAGGTMNDRALYDYHRVELDPDNHSYGRMAEAAPLTRDTFRPFDYAMAPSLQWLVTPGTPGDPTGRETAGFVTAGSYVNTIKTVPLGQPVGVYTGSQLLYVDANGNGAFDFRSMATGNDETTATERYDPATDLPLEPLAAVVPGTVRVTESRLPHSDYYAQDADPVALISMVDNRLQVMWASNRASSDPARNGAAAPGVPAPAGLTPNDGPTSTAPRNLVYATAQGATGGADDPLYRVYYWPVTGGVLDEATMLTADPEATANSAPWAMFSNTGDRWAFWHRSLRHAGGVEATLRYDTSAGGAWAWDGSGATEFIYDTGLAKQNLRGFAAPGGAWLFWHVGTQGRERLMYRWDFTGAPDGNEGHVPVANQVAAGATNDAANARPDANSAPAWTVRRHSAGPFTYAKDPSVFASNEAGTPVVNLFFSGHLRTEDQADICWTRFRMDEMAPAGAVNPGNNLGKLPFVAAMDEEFRGDGLRQRFGSRHLDWLVTPGFEDNLVAAPAVPDPSFRLRLVYDAVGDGQPPAVESFNVTWRVDERGEYQRSRGTYRVTPIFYPIGGASLPPSRALPVPGAPGAFFLRDPSDPASPPATARRLSLEVDPSSGVLQFSSALYNLAAEEYRRLTNPAAPTDPTTVFNSSMTSGGTPLADVLVTGTYLPYIWRVTRSGAQDDSPSAFFSVAAPNRMTVFWRRSYPASEAPHFGRAAFMYRVLNNSIYVGRPPVSVSPTFTDVTTGMAATPVSGDDNSGVYTFAPALDGHYIRADYQGPGGVNYSERHQIIGWSTENVVPVDTVIGEGPLVAVPETYDVPSGTGGTMLAARYWLFWSSPRAVWDMRLVEDNGGTRYAPGAGGAPDLPVHPSTDIYSAVVAPEFGTLRPEVTLSSVTADPT